MATPKYTPTISKQQFDRDANQLKAKLQRKYHESIEDTDRPVISDNMRGAFSHVPDLDSKTVARWSSTFKEVLGCKLDPKLIKPGGYRSFDDFWKDIRPKLRARCPEAGSIARSGVAA